MRTLLLAGTSLLALSASVVAAATPVTFSATGALEGVVIWSGYATRPASAS